MEQEVQPTEEVVEAQVEESVTPAEEVVETAEETVDEQAVEAEAAPEVDEPEEKPKKSRFQERIDKLTADKYAAEREARALKERLAALETRQDEPVDENDWEAVERKRMREVYDATRKEDYSYEHQRAQEQAFQARQELFSAKVEAARDRIPDIDQSLQQFGQLPVTEDSAELIAASPFAAEIAHHLGHNPKKAIELSRMPPAQQGAEIARIESRFNLPQKKVSKAPPPPSKVTSSASPVTKDLREMSAQDYVKMRQAEWNKGRNRK